MSTPFAVTDKVTAFNGMSDDMYMQIPYTWWFIETLVVMLEAWKGLIFIWFVEPIKTLKKFHAYFGVILLISIATCLLPLTVYLIKYMIKDDNDSYNIFMINSKYVADRLTTFAAIHGVECRDFDLNNERDLNELRWIIMSRGEY